MLLPVADELPAPFEVLASCRVCEQSVVADPHQSARQDMEQEAAEELPDVEGHEPFPIPSCTVVPAKGHLVVAEGDESVVGDGHAVGVPAEVAQYLPGSGEGRLAVNDPVLASGSSESCVGVDVLAVEGLVVETRLEPAQQLGAEESRQDPHGEEETGSAGDPTAAWWIETASGDDAMDVRMEEQSLGPGVQDAGESDRGTEIPGVACDVMQGLRDGGKEQAIATPGIGAEQRVKRVGHGEDDVVVLDRQQMFSLGFEPAELLAALAFGTVPVPAGVVGDLAVIAAVALLDVAAEGGGAAVEDGAHDARLPAVEMRDCIAALAEDVSQLELGSISTAVLNRRVWHGSVLDHSDVFQVGQNVEWTGCVLEVVGGDVGVDLRGPQAAVAQE